MKNDRKFVIVLGKDQKKFIKRMALENNIPMSEYVNITIQDIVNKDIEPKDEKIMSQFMVNEELLNDFRQKSKETGYSMTELFIKELNKNIEMFTQSW